MCARTVLLEEFALAESEINELRDSLGRQNRLTGMSKHDLLNAISIVVSYRELMHELPDPDAGLEAEAVQALLRAREVAFGVEFAF